MQLPVVVAVVQHAGVRAAGDDRRVGDRLRAVAQELVQQLGLDLVLVPARARASPSRAGAPPRRSPRRGASASISCASLTRRISSSAPRTSTISVRRGDAGARAAAHLVQQVGDAPVPGARQPERRVQRGLVRREIGQLRVAARRSDAPRRSRRSRAPRRGRSGSRPRSRAPGSSRGRTGSAGRRRRRRPARAPPRARGSRSGNRNSCRGDTDSSESRLRGASGAVGTSASPPPVCARICCSSAPRRSR